MVQQYVPAMTLEEHPVLGYRLTTADFGSYLLSRDGTLVRCAPPDEEQWRWQRFFIGQVLPLASLLRGFEVFHASAVHVNGRVIAFVAASGAGKSSVGTATRPRGRAADHRRRARPPVEDDRIVAIRAPAC